MIASNYPAITRLRFSRYRCFRDRNEVALGRLTLVYGENNAGKSALVRLPALLADSRTPGRAGLDTNSVLLSNGSPRQIQWRGLLRDTESPDVMLALELGDGVYWEWTLEWQDLQRKLLVSAVKTGNAGGSEITFDLDAGLDGLVPVGGQSSEADEHRKALFTALLGVTWLGADRAGPLPSGVSIGASGRLWGDGNKAEANALVEPTLLAGVSAFYEKHANRRLARETRGQDIEALLLEPAGEPGPRVTFDESGSGLRHIFAVLVALETLRKNGGLLIVEEPESHLHPRLQRALAEHMVAVLADNPKTQILLETHSEVFLLAALDAALPNDGLGHDEVRLQWIDAHKDGSASVELIELGPDGRPQTPRLEQAFETMGVMRRQLLAKRRANAS